MKNIVILTLFSVFCYAESLAQQSDVSLSFVNQFDAAPLVFREKYTNEHGEGLSFTLLNYFISNISFTKADGSVYAVPQDSSYFLIKQSDPESMTIKLRIPNGKYQSVSYMLGVDSARSTMASEKRQGVLDVGAQARGMYWRWNSGYIFFKMEGKSPASPDSLKNSFYYHIGGYGGFDSKTLNNIRSKTFMFDSPVRITPKKKTDIVFIVDIKKFFEGTNPLKIAEHPSIMWGPVSTLIADNYVNIFSLKEVRYSKSSE